MLKLTLTFALTTSSLFAQTNPLIPLMVKPPEIESPLDTYMKAQRIRNLQTEQALQQEEIRRVQLENQQRAAAIAAPPPRPAPSLRRPDESIAASDMTHGGYNGRFWKTLTSGEKLAFVIGFTEGVQMPDPPNRAIYTPVKLTFDEISGGVERFYLEPENVLIPIPLSLMILSKKSSGVEQPEIDATVAYARRWSLKTDEELAAERKSDK